MATTHFTAVEAQTVSATTALKAPLSLTADLPTASADNAGEIRIITDNGVGNNELAVVVSTGAAWVVCTGVALS